MIEAEQYANSVLDGRIMAGRLIKLACQRFLKDLTREDLLFNHTEANKFVYFAENHLKQWEGDWEGMPVELQLWQKFHFQQLFGFLKRDTDTRRFTKFFLEIAKKNGKSSECAWLGDFHVFADERVKTPKVFTAANNEDQAKICVNMAGQTIRFSPDLNRMVEDDEVNILTHSGSIIGVVHKTRNGFIKALSKEGGDKKAKTSGGKHGINASLGLVDEFGMSPDHGASGSIATSMASRRERLMAYLTTAGFNMEGPCYRELRDQGIKVLEGALVMDNYLPIIYEIDPPVDDEGRPKEITLQYLKEHEELWYQCNPNLDVSVNREYLREMLNNAISLGGTTEVEVKTLNFNMWVNSPDIWITADKWNANTHGISVDDLIGRECFGAIHIISAREMGVFTLYFPNVKDDICAALPFFFAPKEFINIHKDVADFEKWAKDGLIYVEAGNMFSNEYIFDWLWKKIAPYDLHSVAVPTNMESHDIVQKGFIDNDVKCDTINQGYKGNGEPTFDWEKRILSGKIEHFGNPVLAWSNSQCMAVRKGDDVKVERSGARTAGIVSCINALAQWKTIEAEGRDDPNMEYIEL